MESNETIGKRIKEVREKSGLTQKELAKKIDVKRETVNQWEAGTRAIKAPDMATLADALDVSADYLLRGIYAEQIDAFKDTGLNGQAISKLQEMNKGQYCNVQFCDLINNDEFGHFMISWGEYRNSSNLYCQRLDQFRHELQEYEADSNLEKKAKLPESDILRQASECRQESSSPLYDLSDKLLEQYDMKNYCAFRLQQSILKLEESCDDQQYERVNNSK